MAGRVWDRFKSWGWVRRTVLLALAPGLVLLGSLAADGHAGSAVLVEPTTSTSLGGVTGGTGRSWSSRNPL